MQFQGIITRVMPAVKINTRRGEDFVQTFELTYDQGQYPKKIAFDVFGQEKINELHITLNEQLVCHIDFDTSEHNGRLFNRSRCWRIDRLQQQAYPQATLPQQQMPPYPQPQASQSYYPNQQPAQMPPQQPTPQQPLPPQQGDLPF